MVGYSEDPSQLQMTEMKSPSADHEQPPKEEVKAEKKMVVHVDTDGKNLKEILHPLTIEVLRWIVFVT